MTRVRLQDVAKVAGVSMKTVSNVVHDYPFVSAETRGRVQRAIDELGYRPNASGRRLATGRTGLLALAFADVGLPYFAELAKIVFSEASARGYRLLFQQTDGTLEGEREIISSSEAGLVDGVIFQPSVIPSNEIVQHRGDVPLVLIGERPAPLGTDRVMIDNIEAAALGARHLASLGRRRIAFVGHEEPSPQETSRQRLAGYQQGLEQSGLPLDMSLLIPSAEVTSAAAVVAVGRAIDDGMRFDALMCRDDLAAIGALRALQERGLVVPRDVAVLGWDDISMASFTHPSLSTISPDLPALASAALDLLEERIAGFDGLGRHQLVGYELVCRESAPNPAHLRSTA